MRPPVASKPPERALGSGPMLQRCVEKIMQRANVSETDARHVLQHVVQNALIKDQPGLKSDRSAPQSPMSSCSNSPVIGSLSSPRAPQLEPLPRLTRSLSPNALANLQTMLSRPTTLRLGGDSPPPPRLPSLPPVDSPPQSPQTPDEGSDDDQSLLDMTQACFERQCVQLGLRRSASFDAARDPTLPLFLGQRRGDAGDRRETGRDRRELSGAAALRGSLPLGKSHSSPPPGRPPIWEQLQRPAARPGPDVRGLVGDGPMEVSLQPGTSGIIDLKSRCTDGLLLLSTTASFVPPAPLSSTTTAC